MSFKMLKLVSMKNIILVIIIAISAISCEKVLYIDLPEGEKHIVVNGVLNPDSLLKVKISKSQGILDESKTVYLQNAQAKLYENDVYIEDMNYKRDGFFLSSINPVPGRTYRIDVDYPGFNFVTAENVLPEKNNIVSSEASFVVLSEEIFDDFIFEEYGIKCKVQFEDDVNIKNYYFIGIMTERRIQFEYQIGTDEYSYDSYDYIESDDIVFNSGNSDFKIEGFSGKVFTDDIFNGKFKTINFSFPVYNISDIPESNKFTFCLASISEDLYKYIISYNKNRKNGDNPFAQPVQIYSNVENGIGLFAGFSPAYVTVQALWDGK